MTEPARKGPRPRTAPARVQLDSSALVDQLPAPQRDRVLAILDRALPGAVARVTPWPNGCGSVSVALLIGRAEYVEWKVSSSGAACYWHTAPVRTVRQPVELRYPR